MKINSSSLSKFPLFVLYSNQKIKYNYNYSKKMGCANSKSSSPKKFAKSQLGAPLLKRLYGKLQKSNLVYIVRLKSCEGLISPAGNISGTADAFIEFKMMPEDTIAGNQMQRSSNRPDTLAPTWVPPERFQFICTNPSQSRIIMSVYSFHLSQERVSLGDSFLALKELPLILGGSGMGDSSRSIDKTLKIIDPTTGKSQGSVNISVELLSVEEAVSIQEHTVYEYQRWQPAVHWGASRPGHLLPTDPGKWSNDVGTRFGDAIAEVSAPVPSSWKILKNWYVIATDVDPDGWTYGPDFRQNQWFPAATPTLVVRRRMWNRELGGDLDRQSLQTQSFQGNPLSQSSLDIEIKDA